MRLPAFFRRHTVWLPTAWGWLAGVLAFIPLCALVAVNLHPFLATHQSSGGRLLIVEGWMASDELDQVAHHFRTGNYEILVTTGGPIPATLYQQKPASFADLARTYLIRQGLPGDSVFAVPAPESAQDRTYLSAVMVRLWISDSRRTVDAADVISSGVHSRRSRKLYQMALGPGVNLGIIPTRQSAYDPEAWWTTSAGAKTVLTETISWIWTELFFFAPGKGSYEEKWGLTNSSKQ